LTTHELGLAHPKVVAEQGRRSLVYCSAFQKMMPDLLVANDNWQAAKVFGPTICMD
jgi:hypothetical protein